jgi:prolipoprotein diacylglyceryl transferase
VRPVLFHIGALRVPTHDFFAALGVFVAFALVLRDSRRAGRLDDDMWWVIAGGLLGGALGARLSTLWSYLSAVHHPSLTGAAIDGGKSILGGLPGAYAGVLIAKRIVGVRRSTGDLFAPAVALGIAVGRIGCFLTERVGTPTSVPWGIRVSQTAAARIPDCSWCASGVRMHPSMLYEAFFLAVLSMVLWRLRASALLPNEGDVFKTFLFAYAVFRFAVEFVRGAPDVFAGLTRPQLFLGPSICVMAVYIARRVRTEPRTLPVGIEAQVT